MIKSRSHALEENLFDLREDVSLQRFDGVVLQFPQLPANKAKLFQNVQYSFTAVVSTIFSFKDNINIFLIRLNLLIFLLALTPLT